MSNTYRIIADLHTHTLASTHAYSSVTEMIRAAAEKGLYAIALTDHARTMPGSPRGVVPSPPFTSLPLHYRGVMNLAGIEANVLDFEGHLDIENKRVGVIATESTIQSGLYQQLITEADPAITVYGKPCPLFVPLVEEGWTKDPITEEVARRYLAEILYKDIDTLIMGCTHYPLLRSLLRKVVGEKVTLVNPAYETSQALCRLLRELDLENPGNDELGRQKYQFFASDGVERFNAFAHSVLPEQISDTKQVQIENY